MISSAGNLSLTSPRAGARLAHFLSLGKPRVVLMVLFVTLTGFLLAAPPRLDPVRLLAVLLGTALAAGGSLALNQFLERRVDSRMDRTRGRPLPRGRLTPGEALGFGGAVLSLGLLCLALAVNLISAAVTAATAAWYLWVYTPLKRRTTLCLLLGALSGGMPPVIGWTAARGEVSPGALVLFAILFLWQVPHSLAIARVHREDYAKAGIRLLPVVEPDGGSTGRQVLASSLALLAVGLLPTLLGMAGRLYFVAAFGLGILLLWFGVRLAVSDSTEGARRLLLATLAYLPLLFLVMVLDGPWAAIS